MASCPPSCRSKNWPSTSMRKGARHEPATAALLHPNFFTRLRTATLADWKPYIEHDFVRGLATARYRKPPSCIISGRIMSICIIMPAPLRWAWSRPIHRRKRRLCADIMHSLTHMELPLHVRICAREGISEERALRHAGGTGKPCLYALCTRLRTGRRFSRSADSTCALARTAMARSASTLPPRPGRARPIRNGSIPMPGLNIRTCAARSAGFSIRPQGTASATISRKARAGQTLPDFATASRLEADFWSMGLKAGS